MQQQARDILMIIGLRYRPISCAKYGLEVPVGGGGPTVMITGVTREPAA